MLLTFAMYQLIRFIVHFRSLHVYKKSMSLISLRHYPDLSEGNRRLLRLIPAEIQLALCDEPQIPSTFGWRKPVIVVPALLCSNTAKLNLAIRHELIHIRQHDYLVNMGVQLVSRIFRFHPLVGRISREIHEYSEISCDNEVLSDTSIPARHYAYLLFELLQLPVINQSNMVNMAHPDSNIKKRIHAMNTTQRKSKSIRVSISLFTIILAGISIIMALSGLHDPGAFAQSRSGQNMKIKNPVITINNQLLTLPGRNQNIILNGSLSQIFYIRTAGYGTFLISGKTFDDAQSTGTIKGKKISFSIDNTEVNITTSDPILTSTKENQIWVKHSTDNGLRTLTVVGYGSRQHVYGLQTPSVTGNGSILQIQQHTTKPKKKVIEHPLAMLGFANNYDDYQENNFPESTYYSSQTHSEIVYNSAQKMPELLGGIASIQKNIIYPEEARKKDMQGRVFVEFVINKEGKVQHPKVIRGIGGGCDKEAIRVVKQARFKPAKLHGKPVNMLYSLPIVFKLKS